MSDDPVKQAITELQDLVRCRCHPAYRDRNLHDPDCHCEDADNVALVVARIEELEAKLDTMVAALAYEGRRTDAAEAKLAKAVEIAAACTSKAQAYDTLVKELFASLDKTEQTDEGRYFRPNRISSYRAMDADKLEKVLAGLKSTLEEWKK